MTAITKWRSALTTNSTSTSFTQKVPTATEPSGTGVIDIPTVAGGIGNRYIHLHPYGLDGNDDTFAMRLWGWNKTVEGGVWIPYIIVDIAVVLGNIAGTALLTGSFMADTITLTKGIPAGTFSGLCNTANDTSGTIIVDTLGASKVEFDWDLSGGQEGVSMNCLYRFVDPIGL